MMKIYSTDIIIRDGTITIIGAAIDMENHNIDPTKNIVLERDMVKNALIKLLDDDKYLFKFIGSYFDNCQIEGAVSNSAYIHDTDQNMFQQNIVK